jgi:hypothetical protein
VLPTKWSNDFKRVAVEHIVGLRAICIMGPSSCHFVVLRSWNVMAKAVVLDKCKVASHMTRPTKTHHRTLMLCTMLLARLLWRLSQCTLMSKLNNKKQKRKVYGAVHGCRFTVQYMVAALRCSTWLQVRWQQELTCSTWLAHVYMIS